MRTKIYQINTDRDKKRVKFESLDGLKKAQGNSSIDSSIYDEVFSAELDETDLERIYSIFNNEGHPLHRGHSLSVSDIVVNNYGAFFCNNIGFEKVDFDESLMHKQDNLMRVVYVEPNKPAYEAEIAHTLEAEQKAVGGLIELVYNKDQTAIVCNEGGKIFGLEGNRRLDNGSIIVGSFFVCGLTEDDFRSLTDEEVVKYMARFAEPEDISQAEIEADTGITFIPM